MADKTAGRRALLVVTSTPEDAELPALDVEAQARDLARVLGDPDIGDFDVTPLVNPSALDATRAVEKLFGTAEPGDLLMFYFCGHGLKDSAGDLYFATHDTYHGRLASSSLAAAFVKTQMDRSRSRRIVTILDCSYSGAFPLGGVVTSLQLEDAPTARGRWVLTSSSPMESSVVGSMFTAAIIAGLASGAADLDQDGVVSMDDLYRFVSERLSAEGVPQRPTYTASEVSEQLTIARVPPQSQGRARTAAQQAQSRCLRVPRSARPSRTRPRSPANGQPTAGSSSTPRFASPVKPNSVALAAACST